MPQSIQWWMRKRNIVFKISEIAIRLICLLIFMLNVTQCFTQIRSAGSKDQGCGVTYKNSAPYFRSIQKNLQLLGRRRDSLEPGARNNLVTVTPTVKFSWPLKPIGVENFTYYRMSN